jgi:nifR3 family TIM-barrel protein
MHIGHLELANKTIMAPLAGITDLPFRQLVKAAGCALVCSEMVSSHALVYRSSKTLKMLNTCDDEWPLSVQIFGAVPEIMAEAAQIASENGAAILDINFGCAVKKIVKTGAGVALMREPGRAQRVLSAVRNAIDIPMTIKIRSGWDMSGRQAVEIAKIAQSCGIDAITLHPRTASQGFRGKADWALIAEIKKVLAIPVIGNGDILTPEHALLMLQSTGCDGIMIGRAAIADPMIFKNVLSFIQHGQISATTVEDRFDLMLSYLDAAVDYHGEKRACYMLRSRLGWFSKGMHAGGRFRETIKQISSQKEAKTLILAYRDLLLRKERLLYH